MKKTEIGVIKGRPFKRVDLGADDKAEGYSWPPLFPSLLLNKKKFDIIFLKEYAVLL